MIVAAALAQPLHAQWTKLETQGVAGVFLFTVEFESASVGYAIGSTQSATSVYKTTDGGATWAAVKGVGLNPSSIHFFDESTGLAGGRAPGCGCLAVARTTDGGESWKLDSIRSANGKAERVPTSFGIYTFSFVDGMTGYGAGPGSTIVKSTNAGGTWQRLNTGAVTNDLMATMSFAVETHGYLVASPITNLGSPNILYRTSDGGANWIRTESFIENAAFGEVHSTSASVAFVGGTDGGAAIYRTTDGGANWSKSHGAGGASDVFFGIDFVDQNIGYAVGSGGMIVRTTDGGATWMAEQSGTTEVLQGISIRDGVVYVVGANGTVLRRAAGSSSVDETRWDGGMKLQLTSSSHAPCSSVARQ